MRASDCSPDLKASASDVALNINAEHRLLLVDDSGISSVSLCLCGRSWVGVGDYRNRTVRYEHAVHVFEASNAMVVSAGRVRVEPEWEEYQNIPSPPKGRPPGGPSGKERRAQVAQMMNEGISLPEIAAKLNLTVDHIRKVLSAISQEN